MLCCQILIADDHDGVRKAIHSQLQSRPELRICGKASNGEEAIEKALLLNPDLVILDIRMPLRDGFSAAREIKTMRPDIPILFVSTRDGGAIIEESKLAGAQGFVSKMEIPFKLLKAVDALMQGKTFFTDGVNSE